MYMGVATLKPITQTPEQVRSWAARALPGDDIVYAEGVRPGDAIGAAVRGLRDAGLVTMVSKRVDGRLKFIAQRLPDPAPMARLMRGPEHRGRFAKREIKGRRTAERLIYKLLVEAARRGLPCPTNAELATRAGLSGAVAASYRMRRLVASGDIVVEEPSPLERRVVTIVASGRQTRRALL